RTAPGAPPGRRTSSWCGLLEREREAAQQNGNASQRRSSPQDRLCHPPLAGIMPMETDCQAVLSRASIWEDECPKKEKRIAPYTPGLEPLLLNSSLSIW